MLDDTVECSYRGVEDEVETERERERQRRENTNLREGTTEDVERTGKASCSYAGTQST